MNEAERMIRKIAEEACLGSVSVGQLEFNIERMINRNVAGAYAAAAKAVQVRATSEMIMRDMARKNRNLELAKAHGDRAAVLQEQETAIMALTPADARQAQTEHDAALIQRAIESSPTLKDLFQKANRAVIASAEARARLEELEWLWGKDFGDAYNGGYLNERGRELLLKRMAAARTPDSTKEPE